MTEILAIWLLRLGLVALASWLMWRPFKLGSWD